MFSGKGENENDDGDGNGDKDNDDDLDITNELDQDDTTVSSDDDYNNIPQETYEYYKVENNTNKNMNTVSYVNEHILHKSYKETAFMYNQGLNLSRHV